MQLLGRPDLVTGADLTDAQVTALLQSNALEVSAGCELLDLTLAVVEDISDDLVGGRISRSLNATIHGTCSLSLARELVWGVDLVRPYMVLTGDGMTARFDCGVFCLTTPDRALGEDVPVSQVGGFDRVYLLDRQVGEDYTVLEGETYRQALLDTFAAAGLTGVLIDGSAADDVLPVNRSWPLVPRSTDPDQTDTPVTWLRVVNDLLLAINFRSVWCDERGLFRCQSYAAPASRPVEFTLDADEPFTTLVGEERTSVEDAWAVPNRWVAIASNPPEGVTPSEGNGLVQVRENLDDGPTSQDARGLVWPSVLSYEAATATALSGLIDRRVVLDRALSHRLTVTTGPFPVAGHADIYTYSDTALGGPVRVQSIGWEYDLTGSDVRHVLEVIA